MSVFSKRLLDARADKAMKQTAFGRFVGTSQQNVSRWESEEAYPEYESVVKIADALGEDRADWVAAWEASKPPERSDPDRKAIERRVASLERQAARILEEIEEIRSQFQS